MVKMTLLYAEDDRETRENYIFVLKKYFHEVYAAKDGEEACRSIIINSLISFYSISRCQR